MKSALILYPHQLYPVHDLPEADTVIFVEEPLYFGVDQQYPLKLHKQKLILHRASMRRYVSEVLWPAGMEVDYVDLDVFMSSGDVLERTKKFDKVYVIDPVNEVLTKRLLQARREQGTVPPLEFLPSPNFYLKDTEIRQYFEAKHKHIFTDFYQWQRERFNILIGEDYKPVGGNWCLNAKATGRLAKDHQLPSFAVFGDNEHAKEAIAYVNEHFPDNPGSAELIWPTNHAEARQWLNDFVDNRLEDFAAYDGTIDSKAPWLHHSALSSSINIGLLSPEQVVEAALMRHAKKEVNLQSLELFIRQVLGWREFIRGHYVTQVSQMRGANVFNAQRHLTDNWFNGTLGLPPFDDMVRKINHHAYVHQAERHIIAGNLMLLAEIHPDDIYRWFGELFIDAQDWVLTPNVYALSQFTKDSSPAALTIAASNQVLQISDYERGEWADVWDGLFWRFVEKHRTMLTKSQRTRILVQRLDRLDSDRKRIIGYRADDFLRDFTR